MQASTYHPELARTIPSDIAERIGSILLKTARVLGMFEAYTSIAKRFRNVEPPLEVDKLTVNVLEDLCKRTSGVIMNGENIEKQGNLKGYRDVLDQRVCTISEIRDAAYAVIAEGWNIEEENPALGHVPTTGTADIADESGINTDYTSDFRDNLENHPNEDPDVESGEDCFDMYM